MSEQKLFFNGINGATGDYGLPPMSSQELVGFITHTAPPENLSELRHRRKLEMERVLGTSAGVDASDLAQAGWGVIFSADADPAIKEALQPLLDWRKQQTGELFRVYSGPDALRPGESRLAFMMRHKVGFGVADPRQMPYYLLLVGDPRTIPFSFQYEMDVQRAVGRIHFKTVADYAGYAENVVRIEKGGRASGKRVAFFGPNHDAATQLATEALIQPILTKLGAEEADWEVVSYLGAEATKSRLVTLLGSQETPALLFSATHGMEFPLEDPRQRPHQGALLCQDWPGPTQWRGPIPPDFYLSGDDIIEGVNMDGLILFLFACYGNGTPLTDDFYQWAFKNGAKRIAPAPFLANLPMQLLRRGALAVMGHVDRAWSFSFRWAGTTFPQTITYESALKRLLNASPVGLAFEDFNSLHAEFASMLIEKIQLAELQMPVDPTELAGLWTASNDARNYIILGDPAVRLSYDGGRPMDVSD